jgi:hypothetical protein
LKLTDGNLVYSFGGFPEEYPAEDARISRMTDDNILNFENDAASKGTAQIHRSSPDNIYMTLATGGDNPTFMLQHEGGQNWRYSPSKKFLAKLKAMQTAKETLQPEQAATTEFKNDSVLIDPESLMLGGKDAVKEAFDLAAGEGIFHNATDAAESINSLLSNSAEGIKNFFSERAAKPVSSLLEGYVGAKMLNKARDIAGPVGAVERMRDPKERTDRVIWPMISAAFPVIAGTVANAK